MSEGFDPVRRLVDDLADAGIAPGTLTVHCGSPLDARPDVRLWCQTRTDFEALVGVWGLRPVESKYNQPGQRRWHAERDTAGLRLLVQCVSFQHHPDWQPRPQDGRA